MRPVKSNPLYHSYSNHSASNLDEGAHFCDGLADLHRGAFVSTVAICTGAILHLIRAVEERLLVALDRDEVWGLTQAENLVRRGTRAAAAHFLCLDRSCGVTMAAKHRNDRGLAV